MSNPSQKSLITTFVCKKSLRNSECNIFIGSKDLPNIPYKPDDSILTQSEWLSGSFSHLDWLQLVLETEIDYF